MFGADNRIKSLPVEINKAKSLFSDHHHHHHHHHNNDRHHHILFAKV